MNKKIASEIAIGIILLVVVVVGAALWLQGLKNNQQPEVSNKVVQKPVTKIEEEKGVMCTQDARLCEDGKTYVSRTGPNCEFTECPSNNMPNGETMTDLCKDSENIYRCGKYFKKNPPSGSFEMPWYIYDLNLKLIQTCGGGAPASPDLKVAPMPEICKINCENTNLCLK